MIPKYYKNEEYDPFAIAQAYGLGFALGTGLKYLLRAGVKDEATLIEDLEKALVCIKRGFSGYPYHTNPTRLENEAYSIDINELIIGIYEIENGSPRHKAIFMLLKAGEFRDFTDRKATEVISYIEADLKEQIYDIAKKKTMETVNALRRSEVSSVPVGTDTGNK